MEQFAVAAKKEVKVTCRCNLSLVGLRLTLVVATSRLSAFQCTDVGLQTPTIRQVHLP